MGGSSQRMEGYLNKWTNYATGYKRRWFVLENGILSYYKTPTDYPVSCRGSINMKVARIIADMSDRNRFEVEGKGSVSYHVRADSKEDAKRWIMALTEAKRWLEEMEPAAGTSGNGSGNGNGLGGMRGNNGGSPSMLSLDGDSASVVHAQIRSALMHLDVNEQLLGSLRDYVAMHGNEAIRRLIEDYYRSSASIVTSLRATLNLCDEREAYWKQRLERETERELAMEESLRMLAVEHNELEEKTDQAEAAAAAAAGTKAGAEGGSTGTAEEEFYDAQEDLASRSSTAGTVYLRASRQS